MNQARLPIYVIATLLTCCVLGVLTYRFTSGHLPWERSRAEIEAAFEAHIQEAETKMNIAIKKQASAFAYFIEERKARAKAFSEDVVSISGTWVVIKSHLSGTDATGQKKYIVDKFDQHIFTGKEWDEAMKRSIDGGVKGIERIENELAIALRHELNDNSSLPWKAFEVDAKFNDAIGKLVEASKKEAAKAVVGEVTTQVTAQVATQALGRLAVSGGLMTAGVANSWWTMGGSVVLGIAASAVWNWVTQPAATIEQNVVTELDNLSRNGRRAIQDGLAKVARERSQLWRKTVKEIP